jgi:hypothetical protein
MLLLILIALASLFNDQAIVTPRRTERTSGKGEDRSSVVMIRPVVTGLPPPALKKIRKELELKNILRGQYRLYKARWMGDFDYRVTYNRNYILSLEFNWNAYFADHERFITFDLRDGSLIKGEDLFREDRTTELAKLVDQKLQARLEQMIQDYEGPLDLREVWKRNGPVTFTTDDIGEFSINDKGITFLYDPHFSHVDAWAEPEHRYFFKYSELKSFLKPDSVVSQFVK